jgi:hypothetical protein
MPQVHQALLVVGIVLGSPLMAHGFDCPPITPSTARQPAYGPVADRSRCEGFFDKTVSQPFLELVSLTRGPGLRADVARAPLELSAASRVPLHLLVQPVSSLPYYRMDTQLKPGQALRWDPTRMLSDTGVPPSELGFLALATRQPPTGITAVAPVALSAAAQTLPQAIAIVRPSVDIASLEWRSYRLGVDASSQWIQVPNAQRYAWHRVEVAIALPADGKAVAVDFQARDDKDGKWLPILRLMLLGPLDE